MQNVLGFEDLKVEELEVVDGGSWGDFGLALVGSLQIGLGVVMLAVPGAQKAGLVSVINGSMNLYRLGN